MSIFFAYVINFSLRCEYMRKLFGTDGIRGKANVYPMTADVALNVGKAVAHLFKRNEHRPRIIVGKDTRISGYVLEHAIVSGICSMGVDAILVGPMPTPGMRSRPPQ